MTVIHPTRIFAALAAAAAFAAQAAPQYHLTGLGPQSSATQINRDGSIAGRYRSLPAVWHDAAWHTLQGSNHMEANSVNGKR